jgi:hypothetical protein
MKYGVLQKKKEKQELGMETLELALQWWSSHLQFASLPKEGALRVQLPSFRF